MHVISPKSTFLYFSKISFVDMAESQATDMFASSFTPAGNANYPDVEPVELYWENHSPSGTPIAHVLFLHGYDDHCGRYRHYLKYLAEQGMNVFAYDARGLGKSGGVRLHIENYNDYLFDLEEMIKLVREKLKDEESKALFLMGHSNGGLTLTRWLCSERGLKDTDFAGVVIVSPFIEMAISVPIKEFFGKLIGHIFPKLYLGNELTPEMLMDDPEMQKARVDDQYCRAETTTGWFLRMLDAQAFVKENVAKMHVPTLWIIGSGDVVSNSKVNEACFNQIAFKDKELEIYPEFRHELLMSLGRQQVFERVQKWFLAHLDGKSESQPEEPQVPVEAEAEEKEKGKDEVIDEGKDEVIDEVKEEVKAPEAEPVTAPDEEAPEKDVKEEKDVEKKDPVKETEPKEKEEAVEVSEVSEPKPQE